MNYFSVTQSLTWLFKDREGGLLPTLSQQLLGSGLEKEEQWLDSIELLFARIPACKEHWNTLAQGLYDWLALRAQSGTTSENSQLVARIDQRENDQDRKSTRL